MKKQWQAEGGESTSKLGRSSDETPLPAIREAPERRFCGFLRVRTYTHGMVRSHDKIREVSGGKHRKNERGRDQKQKVTSLDAWISSVKEGAAGFCGFRSR